jgi:hypothetical protein
MSAETMRYNLRYTMAAGTAALALLAGLLGGCSSAQNTPMNGPVDAMTEAWGPFARQCGTTRLSHFVYGSRLNPEDVTQTHIRCIGFTTMPGSNSSGPMAITASLGTDSEFASPRIVRFLRDPGGLVRPAAAGDTGLLAQGSDDPAAAIRLAQRIGLTKQQLIEPGETVNLTIRFSLPDPVDVRLSCRPDGGGRLHGRDTLIFSCTGDEAVRTDDFAGQLQVAGVAELDVRSGVRLASRLSGHLTGDSMSPNGGRRHVANERLLYSLDTEFE